MKYNEIKNNLKPQETKRSVTERYDWDILT